MIDALLRGSVLGLALSIMIGPAFFAHLQSVIYKGYLKGTIFLIGIILSDLFLIVLAYFGFAQIVHKPQNEMIFGIIGGSVLIGMGIYTFRKKVRFSEMRPRELKLKTKGVLTDLLKGFALNFANPFVWIFWLGVVSFVTTSSKGNDYYVLLFFISVEGVYLLINILKTFLAYKVKRALRPRTIFFVNRIVGIIMFIFGVSLILKVLFS